MLHTRYRVSDLERAVSFFREVLGLGETARYHSPRGAELVFLQIPGDSMQVELCHHPASGPIAVASDLTHLALAVDDLESFACHALAHGYPLSDGPLRNGDDWIAFLDGPDGYEIELIQHDAAAVAPAQIVRCENGACT